MQSQFVSSEEALRVLADDRLERYREEAKLMGALAYGTQGGTLIGLIGGLGAIAIQQPLTLPAIALWAGTTGSFLVAAYATTKSADREEDIVTNWPHRDKRHPFRLAGKSIGKRNLGITIGSNDEPFIFRDEPESTVGEPIKAYDTIDELLEGTRTEGYGLINGIYVKLEPQEASTRVTRKGFEGTYKPLGLAETIIRPALLIAKAAEPTIHYLRPAMRENERRKRDNERFEEREEETNLLWTPAPVRA